MSTGPLVLGGDKAFLLSCAGSMRGSVKALRSQAMSLQEQADSIEDHAEFYESRAREIGVGEEALKIVKPVAEACGVSHEEAAAALEDMQQQLEVESSSE